MLVDAADDDDYPLIESTLNKYGVRNLGVLVASHFDSDHIGSMDEVVENTQVDSVYISNYKDGTKDYRNLMRALKDKNITPTVAQAGMTFKLGDASIEALNPENKKYAEANSACVILKVSYGRHGFSIDRRYGRRSAERPAKQLEGFAQLRSTQGGASWKPVGHHRRISSGGPAANRCYSLRQRQRLRPSSQRNH